MIQDSSQVSGICCPIKKLVRRSILWYNLYIIKLWNRFIIDIINKNRKVMWCEKKGSMIAYLVRTHCARRKEKITKEWRRQSWQNGERLEQSERKGNFHAYKTGYLETIKQFISYSNIADGYNANISICGRYNKKL